MVRDAAGLFWDMKGSRLSQNPQKRLLPFGKSSFIIIETRTIQ
jgi:hypothetical protein